MAKTALLLVACLAVFAGHVAAKCNSTMTLQSATLKSQSPKGCLEKSMAAGGDFEVPVDASCLNDLVMNSTNSTGTGCTSPGTQVSVGFKNTTCWEGPIASATRTNVKGGGSLVKGSFEALARNFTGTVSPDGTSMVVSVENVTCALTYSVKTLDSMAMEAEPEAEAEANTTAPAAEAPGASPASAAAPAPKSSAAGISSLPAAVLALVAAALAVMAL